MSDILFNFIYQLYIYAKERKSRGSITFS